MNISYRCLKCGHKFIFVKGDFIHDRIIPVCPKCGSRLVNLSLGRLRKIQHLFVKMWQ